MARVFNSRVFLETIEEVTVSPLRFCNVATPFVTDIEENTSV